MNWGDLIAAAILVTGAAGYGVALALALRMRLWLGRRGRGWPRILLDTLIVCLVGLATLYGISLGRQLHLLGRVVLGVLNVAAATFLAVLPWCFAFALHRWRREAEHQATRRQTRQDGIPDD